MTPIINTDELPSMLDFTSKQYCKSSFPSALVDQPDRIWLRVLQCFPTMDSEKGDNSTNEALEYRAREESIMMSVQYDQMTLQHIGHYHSHNSNDKDLNGTPCIGNFRENKYLLLDFQPHRNKKECQHTYDAYDRHDKRKEEIASLDPSNSEA